MGVRSGPAVVLATAALLAGCGSSGPSAQEWTDQACGAVLPFVQVAVAVPPAEDDPAERVRVIGDYLTRTTSTLDRTLGDLDRLGPAPVDDGDRLAADVQGGLGEIRSAFAGARDRVAALDPADPDAVERGLPEALEPVSRLGGTAGPLSRVTANPELATAFRASPRCTELGGLSDQARESPPNGAVSVDPNGIAGEGGGG